MAIGLRLFTGLPLTVGTMVDPYVAFTGDGVTTQFYLGAGNGSRVGNEVLVNNVLITRGTGGFTISGDYLTITPAPANGAVGVVPGIGYINETCTDQSGTNISTTMVYLGDPDQIFQYQYIPTPPNANILLSPYNMTPGSGALPSWFQLSLADGNNNPIGYTAAGGTLSIPNISAQDILQSPNSGANITVATGSNFSSGYLLNMNPGASNNEIVTVVSVSGNTITTTGFNFSHSAGEPVYHCGYPLLIQVTVPVNIVGGVATAVCNCGIRRTARQVFRF